jgi:hypothetical protein
VPHERRLVLQRKHSDNRIEGRVAASEIADESDASFFCGRMYGFT